MGKVVRVVAVLVLLAFAIVGAWLYYAPRVASPVELQIRPGASVRVVARDLAERGVVLAAEPLVWLMRLSGKDRSIKAGSYEFDTAAAPLEVLEILTAGDDTQVALTIVEGWTFDQMKKALSAAPNLQHSLEQATLPEALQRIGVAEAHPEGLFFPDTYHFSPGSSDFAVYRRAHRAMKARLQAAWDGRAPDLPYATPYEALIMASIVEKETGQGRDRVQIASVFVNREAGMKLQTDPTVIYGMGAGFDGNLRRRDLETDTPYNTYTRAGLPPTPIALPGQASLTAALHPDKTNYLYFVARGDGSSQFSTNLEDHNRAVNKYQRNGNGAKGPTVAMNGRFITVEGIDGAGKSTHVPYVRELAAARSGTTAIVTREPGGTALGERLRELLLHLRMTPSAEAMLMFAARREHLETVIWPALERGEWVICDRFTDATMAYQGGGRGIPLERLAALESWTHPSFQPDLTLLFDVPVEVGADRLAHHGNLDKFESEEAPFHHRVRAAYLARAAADPRRFRTVDSTQPVAAVRAALRQVIETL